MRVAFRLLTMICLMWCAIGVSEPVAGYDTGPMQIEAVSITDAGAVPDDCADTELPGHHHHCPVSPDLRTPAPFVPALPDAAPPVAAHVAALASLSHAPPLQPPAA